MNWTPKELVQIGIARGWIHRGANISPERAERQHYYQKRTRRYVKAGLNTKGDRRQHKSKLSCSLDPINPASPTP